MENMSTEKVPQIAERGVDPNRFYSFQDFCLQVSLSNAEIKKEFKRLVAGDEGAAVLNDKQIYFSGEIGIKHIFGLGQFAKELSRKEAERNKSRKNNR